MTSILFGILEIAGHYRGKDGQRKLRTFDNLRKATINGHDVLAVIADTDEEPTTVKHFGYDHRCTNGCNHETMPWGVKRYFGINLIVSGDWDMLTYPATYWVNPHTQISITGKVSLYDGQRHKLEKV